MRTRPTGILIIGLFLLVAPIILVVAAISLLVPETFLDQIWVVNETGYQQLLPVRGLVGIGFLALGVMLGLAGVGLLKGRKWDGGLRSSSLLPMVSAMESAFCWVISWEAASASLLWP
jgi:hypothetical protein